MAKELTPFDFIKSASHNKKDLVAESDTPKETEKLYVPYIINRGFSYFEDTVLHANEMNRLHGLFNDAQYKYYLGALRPRNRFSKWHKAEKDDEIVLIQQYFQCNRTVARQYQRVLTKEKLEVIKAKLAQGGA